MPILLPIATARTTLRPFTDNDVDDLLDCCTILTAIGEGIELRRVVQPEERAS